MSTILIISLFILLPSLIIGLLVLIEARGKQRVRRLLQDAVGQLIPQNDMWRSDIEYFRNKVIGIDTANNRLIFAHVKNGVVDKHVFHLNSISSCMVSKEVNGHSNITRIFLRLGLKQEFESIRLSIYDKSIDNPRTEGSLLQKARFWKNLINLSRRPKRMEGQLDYVL